MSPHVRLERAGGLEEATGADGARLHGRCVAGGVASELRAGGEPTPALFADVVREVYGHVHLQALVHGKCLTAYSETPYIYILQVLLFLCYI